MHNYHITLERTEEIEGKINSAELTIRANNEEHAEEIARLTFPYPEFKTYVEAYELA